ncbi:MAG: hypothetical protein AAF514_20660 [Verrucomicrobiota bacterium]
MATRFRSDWDSHQAPQKSSLYSWTVAIVILAALDIFFWLFPAYVFRHPEKPMNYELLTRINRVPELKSYSRPTAPTGVTLGPKGIYDRFSGQSGRALAAFSAQSRSDYLRNYAAVQKVLYLDGEFTITASRELTEADFIKKGLVVTGEAVNFPNVSVELILPTATIPETRFQPGNVVRLRKSAHYPVVLNIQSPSKARLSLSVIPLSFPAFPIDGKQVVKTRPPESVNPKGKWPIF